MEESYYVISQWEPTDVFCNLSPIFHLPFCQEHWKKRSKFPKISCRTHLELNFPGEYEVEEVIYLI